MIDDPRVAIRVGERGEYPSCPPFDPHTRYPEYQFSEIDDHETNEVYELVRASLIDLCLDADNVGTVEWSPFRELVRPGNTIVIKPNMVLDTPWQDIVTTHGSVIRPLIDYAWKALRGDGTIVVCDAPVAQANFQEITRRNGLASVVDSLVRRGVNVRVDDLRALKVIGEHGVWIDEQDIPDKRTDATVIDLKEMSSFASWESGKRALHGGGYGHHTTDSHHRSRKHEYCVSKTVLDADAVISVPKLKTHCKAGFTCCLKNLVGINVDKNYLPHFSIGAYNTGGDEFPRVASWRLPLIGAARIAHEFLLGKHWRTNGRWISRLTGILGAVCGVRERDARAGHAFEAADAVYRLLTGVTCRQGAWQGNETIWRMILDLNRLFLYARSDGSLADTVQRKVFFTVDGYLSGDGDGPLRPTTVRSRLIASGFNAASVDLALLGAAGINPDTIPLYREVSKPQYSWLHPNEAPSLILNGKRVHEAPFEQLISLRPPKNWSFCL
jgi:uncharacterized protein (DUF362 family)